MLRATANSIDLPGVISQLVEADISPNGAASRFGPTREHRAEACA